MIGRLRSRKGAIVAIGLAACLGSVLLGAYGGVASGSEPKLSWYVCAKFGPHEYEDSKCSKASGSGLYYWARVTNRTFSSSGTSTYKIRYVKFGTPSEIQCSGANTGSGVLTGNETGAGVESYTLNLTECFHTAPIESGCKIKGGAISLPLNGSSPVSPETLKPEIKMSLTSTVSFVMESCKAPLLNGTYEITGGFPAQVNNTQSSMSTTAEESKGQLKMNGGITNASIEGSSSLLATGFSFGSVPVKLATAP